VTLGGVRDFLRARLDALGYREHEDAFNFSNVPSTVLDRAYHLECGTMQVAPPDGRLHTFTFPITARFYFKGYRNPSEAVDAALAEGQTILSDLLDPEVRLQTEGLKNIRLTSVSPQPLQNTNDNAIILEINLNTLCMVTF
jgi:hypothetical protein